jgi:hypothetical protein
VAVEPQLLAVLAAATAVMVLRTTAKVGVVAAAQVGIPAMAVTVALKITGLLVRVAAVAAVPATTETVARWAQVEVLGF